MKTEIKVHKLRVLVSAFVEVEITGDLTKNEAIEQVKNGAHIGPDSGEIYFNIPILHFGDITQRQNKVIHKGTYILDVPNLPKED